MSDDKRDNGAGEATAIFTVLFLVTALATAVNVGQQFYGRATFYGFCTLYFLMVARLTYDDWIHSDEPPQEKR